mmetsp:Transcript_2531/g.6391  ORF Transcript_2531/g.6391 Transcript_2531/m.6391 type:complete len:228 (-) Transcript_2531:637-1320(-)
MTSSRAYRGDVVGQHLHHADPEREEISHRVPLAIHPGLRWYVARSATCRYILSGHCLCDAQVNEHDLRSCKIICPEHPVRLLYIAMHDGLLMYSGQCIQALHQEPSPPILRGLRTGLRGAFHKRRKVAAVQSISHHVDVHHVLKDFVHAENAWRLRKVAKPQFFLHLHKTSCISRCFRYALQADLFTSSGLGQVGNTLASLAQLLHQEISRLLRRLERYCIHEVLAA